MKRIIAAAIAVLITSSIAFAVTNWNYTAIVDSNGNPLSSTALPPVTGTGGFTGSLSVGVSSAQLAAAAARTTRLAVKNESASASIAVCLGTCTAALNTSGSMTIGPGQMLTLSDAAYVPGDAVNAIASLASTPATVWSK